MCNFTVKNLSSTIPSLLDKINKIEELSLQAGPISNVSENIKRIKELIEQARDAANRVRLRILKMWMNLMNERERERKRVNGRTEG